MWAAQPDGGEQEEHDEETIKTIPLERVENSQAHAEILERLAAPFSQSAGTAGAPRKGSAGAPRKGSAGAPRKVKHPIASLSTHLEHFGGQRRRDRGAVKVAPVASPRQDHGRHGSYLQQHGDEGATSPITPVTPSSGNERNPTSPPSAEGSRLPASITSGGDVARRPHPRAADAWHPSTSPQSSPSARTPHAANRMAPGSPRFALHNSAMPVAAGVQKQPPPSQSPDSPSVRFLPPSVRPAGRLKRLPSQLDSVKVEDVASQAPRPIRKMGPRLSAYVAEDSYKVAPPWAPSTDSWADSTGPAQKGHPPRSPRRASCVSREWAIRQDQRRASHVAQRLGPRAREAVLLAATARGFLWRHQELQVSGTSDAAAPQRLTRVVHQKVTALFARKRYRRMIIRLRAFARVAWLWRRLQESQRLLRTEEILGASLAPLRGCLPHAKKGVASSATRQRRQGKHGAGMLAGKALGSTNTSQSNAKLAERFSVVYGTSAVLAFLHQQRLVDPVYIRESMMLASTLGWDADEPYSFSQFAAVFEEFLRWPGDWKNRAFAALWNLRFLQRWDGGYEASRPLAHTLYGKYFDHEKDIHALAFAQSDDKEWLIDYLRELQISTVMPAESQLQEMFLCHSARELCERGVRCGCCLPPYQRADFEALRNGLIDSIERHLRSLQRSMAKTEDPKVSEVTFGIIKKAAKCYLDTVDFIYQ
ncbi:hypothetical protein CYMTET_22242 [Cymbomonas tetramitiformis]|uniref:Uncharacterized protein n=1 Tax=Cymbomonas tetramitiformis TaxID=36881 RepID=A0AAE0G0M8_9CHLO|nr:hypothetical protein CYMTET_22242 [Cymbomonas tetramitiformis]